MRYERTTKSRKRTTESRDWRCKSRVCLPKLLKRTLRKSTSCVNVTDLRLISTSMLLNIAYCNFHITYCADILICVFPSCLEVGIPKLCGLSLSDIQDVSGKKNNAFSVGQAPNVHFLILLSTQTNFTRYSYPTSKYLF